MSDYVSSGAPLSLHIKLFRELQKFVGNIEKEKAFGKECSVDSDCDLTTTCVNGYCLHSKSNSYEALEMSCQSSENVSLSAYLFNECIVFGRLGKDDEMTNCLNDLKEYLVFVYLKSIKSNIDVALKKWIVQSRNIMRYGMLEDPVSNDYTIEGIVCSNDYECIKIPKITETQCDYSESDFMSDLNNNVEDTLACDKKFGKHYECKQNKCVSKQPKMNLIEIVSGYTDILKGILTIQNNPVSQLLSISCNDINRYNYVEICEYTKNLLQTEVNDLILGINNKLNEKIQTVIEPLTYYIIKFKEIFELMKTPENFVNLAYCNKNIDSCINCQKNIIINNTTLSYSDLTNKLNRDCSSQCSFSEILECQKSKEIKQYILSDMNLATITKTGTVIAFSMKYFDNIKLESTNLTTCPTGITNIECYHQKLMDAGKRFGFANESNESISNYKTFQELSPYGGTETINSINSEEIHDVTSGLAPLYNSKQFNKLTFLSKSFMKSLYKSVLGSDIDVEKAMCLKLENYAFESIASLDGSKDIANFVDKFDELKREPMFCLKNKSLTAEKTYEEKLYDSLFKDFDFSDRSTYSSGFQIYHREENLQPTKIITKPINTLP